MYEAELIKQIKRIPEVYDPLYECTKHFQDSTARSKLYKLFHATSA